MATNPIGSVLAEFNFGVPPGYPAVDVTRLVHTETVIHAALYQAVTHEHQFAITGTRFVSDLLRAALATATPTVGFRFGIKMKDRSHWFPWQDHVIVSHAVVPEGRGSGSGSVLRISTADQLYAMDRATRVVVRKGKVSGIVRQIAKENGLESVVEPTLNEGVYIQNYLSDAQFIRERMCPRALSEKRAGQYVLFVRDNVLHFHTPDYQGILHGVNYHASSAIRLVGAEHMQQLYSAGAAGVRMMVVDPYTGETREVGADPSKTLRYAEAMYPSWSLKNGERNEFYHLSQNDVTEVEALSQYAYDTARSKAHHLEITFTSFVDINPGDFVELVYSQADEPSPLAGLYHVVKADHFVKDSAINSSYILQRGETIQLLNDTVVKDGEGRGSPVKMSLKAPGRDLDRALLSSSRFTSGGGDQTSATLMREVTDGSSLPKGMSLDLP